VSFEQAQTFRKAIENLMNAKLHDALERRDGLDRLIAHRQSGVASKAVREAEQQLEEVIAQVLPVPAAPSRTNGTRQARPGNDPRNDGDGRRPTGRAA
jgi:hypothetical protein